MTPEEIAAKDAAVQEATDDEIAEVFCKFSMWEFEPLYYINAKVALVAAKARGLSTEDLRRLSMERMERQRKEREARP